MILETVYSLQMFYFQMKIELEVAENLNWSNYFRKQMGLCIYRKMKYERSNGTRYHEVPNNLFIKALEFVNMTEQQSEELLKSLHESRQSSKRELKKVIENTATLANSSQKLGKEKVYNTLVIQGKLKDLEEDVQKLGEKLEQKLNEISKMIATLTEHLQPKGN